VRYETGDNNLFDCVLGFVDSGIGGKSMYAGCGNAYADIDTFHECTHEYTNANRNGDIRANFHLDP
jgi:hypothetical protein